MKNRFKMDNIKVYILYVFILTVGYAQADQNTSCEYVYNSIKIKSLEEKYQDLNRSYTTSYNNYVKQIRYGNHEELLRLEREYEQEVKRLKKSFNYEISVLIDKYHVAEKSYTHMKWLFTFVFTVFLAFAAYILNDYRIKITKVKESFDDREEEYKKNLDELSKNKLIEYNNVIDDEKKRTLEEQETQLGIMLEPVRKDISSIISDKTEIQEEIQNKIEELMKSKIKNEIKVELKEECNIQCDEEKESTEPKQSVGNNPWGGK